MPERQLIAIMLAVEQIEGVPSFVRHFLAPEFRPREAFAAVRDWMDLRGCSAGARLTNTPDGELLAVRVSSDEDMEALTRFLGELDVVPAARASDSTRVGRSNLKPADRLLVALASLIPRKSREAVIGDLAEDVRDYRDAGWTEKQIRRHLWWQFGIIALERCKGVFRCGSFAWLGKTLWGWIVRKWSVR